MNQKAGKGIREMIDFILENYVLIGVSLATVSAVCAVIGLFLNNRKQANLAQNRSVNIEQGENGSVQLLAGNNNQQAGRDIVSNHYDAQPAPIVTPKNGIKSIDRIMGDGTEVNLGASLDSNRQ